MVNVVSRCPDCDTSNGWHTSGCPSGMFNASELEALRAQLKVGNAMMEVAAKAYGFILDPRVAEFRAARLADNKE